MKTKSDYLHENIPVDELVKVGFFKKGMTDRDVYHYLYNLAFNLLLGFGCLIIYSTFLTTSYSIIRKIQLLGKISFSIHSKKSRRISLIEVRVYLYGLGWE